MRQFVFITVLAAVIAVSMAQMTKEEFMEKMQKGVDECKQEFAISDDELAGLMKKQVPTSQEGKCFIGCMFEKCGSLKDGKFSVEGASYKAKVMFADNPEKLKKANEVVAQCGSAVTTTDKCVSGPELLACYADKMPDL